MHETSGTLTPVAPFDMAMSLRFLEGFSPTEGEQAIAAGSVRKGLRVGGRTVVFEVGAASDGTVEASLLAYRTWSEDTIHAALEASVAERIGLFLSIDDHVANFYRVARADPVLARHVDRLHGLHQVRFLTPFENACWAVMGQHAPIATARPVKDRFVERYGGALEVDGELHRAFPEAGDVAGLTANDLEPLARNPRRAVYLANVIEAWQDADKPWLRTGPHDEVEAWLRSITGEALRAAYGERSDAELQAILDGYGPWAGYALLYLRASG